MKREISDKVKIKGSLFPEVLGTENHQKVEAIKTKELLMLSVNTTITVGSVEKIKDNDIELALNIPIVPLKGENLGQRR